MEATTQSPPCPYFSAQNPPHLFTPFTLLPPHSPPSLPLLLSFSFSVLPGCWRVQGMLQAILTHNRLWFLDQQKKKKTLLHYKEGGGLGGLRKKNVLKSCNNETVAWIWKKRYCLKQLLYSRFHKGLLFQQWNSCWSGGTIRILLLKKLFIAFLFFLWCVFWDQSKEERWKYDRVKSKRQGAFHL